MGAQICSGQTSSSDICVINVSRLQGCLLPLNACPSEEMTESLFNHELFFHSAPSPPGKYVSSKADDNIPFSLPVPCIGCRSREFSCGYF